MEKLPISLKFEIQFQGQVLKGDLQSELYTISDPLSLSQAMSENPGRFAYWAAWEVEARSIVERLENERAEMYSRMYRETEMQLRPGKSPMPTIEGIKSVVLGNKKYQAHLTALGKAKRDLGLIQVMRTALVHRKDILMELARNYRADLSVHQEDHLKSLREAYHSRNTRA